MSTFEKNSPDYPTVADVCWQSYEFPRVHLMSAINERDPYEILGLVADAMADKYPNGARGDFLVGLAGEAGFAVVVDSRINVDIYSEGVGDGGEDVPVNTDKHKEATAQVKCGSQINKNYSRRISMKELRTSEYIIICRTPWPPVWTEVIGWQESHMLLPDNPSDGYINCTLDDFNAWPDTGEIYGSDSVNQVL